MELKNVLRTSRLKAGLSQAETADKLGYSTPQFISNWERGVSRPPIRSLKKLASLYKMSAEGLFEEILKEELAIVTIDLRRKFESSK